jgi:hypothetical protein
MVTGRLMRERERERKIKIKIKIKIKMVGPHFAAPATFKCSD